jgi:hypothetical protein
VPQSLVALQRLRRQGKPVFARVDDRLQLRQMPPVFLLRLELEDRLAETIIHPGLPTNR